MVRFAYGLRHSVLRKLTPVSERTNSPFRAKAKRKEMPKQYERSGDPSEQYSILEVPHEGSSFCSRQHPRSPVPDRWCERQALKC